MHFCTLHPKFRCNFGASFRVQLFFFLLSAKLPLWWGCTKLEKWETIKYLSKHSSIAVSVTHTFYWHQFNNGMSVAQHCSEQFSDQLLLVQAVCEWWLEVTSKTLSYSGTRNYQWTVVDCTFWVRVKWLTNPGLQTVMLTPELFTQSSKPEE